MTNKYRRQNQWLGKLVKCNDKGARLGGEVLLLTCMFAVLLAGLIALLKTIAGPLWLIGSVITFGGLLIAFALFLGMIILRN